MSLADIRDRQNRLGQQRIAELIAQLGRTPTELELRTAADALGVADRLPEPQASLDPPTAA